MAIKNRRGEYANFDPYKMLQGEWGITTSGDPNSADGKSVYMCFAAGDVKRMATYDDMVENIDRATEKVQERLTQEVREATAEANSTIQKATQATQSANTAADRANDAAEAAESYVLGDISGKTVTFEMALQRANIQSNDSLAVAFGKLAKFCADLDDHAFSAPVPNLLSDDSTKSLAASMGKALKTDIGDLTQLPTTAKGSLVEAITEQNSALSVKDRTLSSNYINCSVTEYGLITWFHISGYPTQTLKENITYSPFTLSGNKPRRLIYQRLQLQETKGIIFRITTDGKVQLAPYGADFTPDDGINISVVYITA